MKRIKIVSLTLFFVMTGALTSFAQGWQEYADSWGYEKEDGTIARQEWIQDNEAWYYLKADGLMACQEWIQDNEVWYYLKLDGLMACQEWIEENGEKYYLGESGIWNHDAQEAAFEEERYQQWLQSIEAGEPREILD